MKPKVNMIKGDMPAHAKVKKAAMISIAFNVLEILAGVAMVLLVSKMLHEGVEEHVARKKAIYERYREGLKGLPITMNPYDPSEAEPNFWLSCLLIDESAMCKQVRSDNETCYISESGKTCPDEILEKLAQYNAEGRPIWKPMHLQPVYAECDFFTAEGLYTSEKNCNIGVGENTQPVGVGEDIFNRGLCLPSDIKNTAEDMERIIEIVSSQFK